MKLLNGVPEIDVYSEKVQVELTVGELLMLKNLSGTTNSNEIANEIENNNKEHGEFASEVRSKMLNSQLYTDLSSILHQTLDKGRC